MSKKRRIFSTERPPKAPSSAETDVVHGQVPEADPPTPEMKTGPEVAQLRKKLKRARGRLERKDEELARLREELARASGTGGAASDAGTRKFFLVGQAKSGTSWLMGLLHAHPEILCRGEGKLFGKDSPHTLHGALAQSVLLQKWLPRNPWTLQDEDPGLEDILGVCIDYLMAEKLRKRKGRLVGDKTTLMGTEDIKEISAVCPGSKVIHIVRDGRDVAVSTVHHRWNNAADEGGNLRLSPEQTAKRDAYRADRGAFGASGESIFSEGEAAELACRWRERVGRAVRDGSELLGDDYYQIHYEDLLVRSVALTREILQFLGVDSGEEVATRCVEAVSFERKSNRHSGEEDPTSFYRKGVSGDWKGVFTEEDRQTFKREAGDLLIELGYAEGNDW